MGKAGSLWLGGSINMHEDIVCSSGCDHLLTSLDYWYNKDHVRKILESVSEESLKNGAITYEYVDGFSDLANYRETVGYGLIGAGNLIQDYYSKKGQQIKIPPRKYHVKIIEDYFEELKSARKAKFYGSVHAFLASGFNDFSPSKDFLREKNVVVLDLIRNPITRFEAQINNCVMGYNVYQDMMRDEIEKSLVDNIHKVKYLEKEYKVDFSDIKNKCIFYNIFGVNFQWAWANDIVYSDFPRLYFERLRYDQDYFSWLINYITKGKVTASKDYLDKVYSVENINSGRSNKTPKKDKSARDQWEEWPQWLKEELRKQFVEHDLKNLYSKHGYDLSFIK